MYSFGKSKNRSIYCVLGAKIVTIFCVLKNTRIISNFFWFVISFKTRVVHRVLGFLGKMSRIVITKYKRKKQVVHFCPKCYQCRIFLLNHLYFIFMWRDFVEYFWILDGIHKNVRRKKNWTLVFGLLGNPSVSFIFFWLFWQKREIFNFT